MGLIGEYRVDLARGFMHIAEGVGSVRPRARPRNFIAPMPSKILTAVLILQAVLFYGLSRGELAVPLRPLSEFPPQTGEWQMQRDNTMDEDVKESLRADDYLARDYPGFARPNDRSIPRVLQIAARRSDAPLTEELPARLGMDLECR
jgi:hypothetical protein